MERRSNLGSPEAPPSLVLALPAVATVALSLVFVVKAFPLPQALLPLALLGLLSLVINHLSEEIAWVALINLAFFLALLTALAAPLSLGLPLGAPLWLSLAGSWGAGALVLALGTLECFYRAGLAKGLAFLGLSCLRWWLIGGALLLPLGLAWPLAWVICAGLGLGAFWLSEVFLTAPWLKNLRESEREAWLQVLIQNRSSLSLQIALGVMGAGLTQGLSAQWSGVAWLPLVLAALISTPLVGSLRACLRVTLDEQKLVEQESLQQQIKKLEFEAKSLRGERDSLSDEVKRKNEELTIIYDLARCLGASTNLDETTALILSMIRRMHIPYQSLVIFLSKQGGSLEPALADTPYQEVLGMSGLLQLQEPFILQVLRDPRPYMNNDVNASTSEQRIFKDERSLLVVPLMVSKENVGIIYLGSVNAKTHKEEHLEKLKMLAAFAAPSIKTALLFEHKEKDLQSERQIREAVEAKNHQLNGLQQLGAAIGTSLKLENSYRVVADNIRQMVPNAQSVILFGVSENHILKAELINSPYSDFVRGLAVRNDEGILGQATEQNRTLLIADTELSEHHNLINNERSVIAAPLKAEDEVLGLLYVGAAKERAFTEEHRSLVETVSYQAAIAIKNALLYEQTQQMAVTDGLTGLYLHRYFQDRLLEEIAWADRYHKPICLVMVDTDRFKQFNDTLGHPAGDALLKEIALLLKDKVRASDIVCRYGGDEFALILKDMSKEEALPTCERIRETFQLRFAAAAVQVTASIGLACYPSDALNKKDLAKAADDALYVSKREGRNRVTLAPSLDEGKDRPEIVQESLPR